ncbi:MAG: AAA family ATPase [Nitrolancea sp.]
MPDRGDPSEVSPLAELLQRYLSDRGLSQADLAKRAGLARATVNRWFHGASERPYHRAGVLSAAAALELRRSETNRLLRAAGYPPLDRIALAPTHDELELLARWSTDVPNNLPADLTSFVGREEDLSSLAELLCEPPVRLATLTGPGGSGKTRLALRLAREVADLFPDGVYFISLGAVTDSRLVLQTIAEATGLRDVQDGSLSERLSVWLRMRCVLLVLDNFEQLIDTGPVVADLLRHSPSLKVLATSRVPLHITGEHEWQVRPLPLPSREEGSTEFWTVPAVELFVQRASAANPRLDLDDDAAASVGEICTRLDGLPLAIELAAARLRDHELAKLLADFPSRLDLGSDGPRDAPERQQTLRRTIAWSVDLLPETECSLFACLSVFVGGWTADAAAAVCFTQVEPRASIDRQLSTLLDASLIESVPAEPGAARYRMLETIREFALELRKGIVNEAELRDRHADYFVGLAHAFPPYVPEARLDDSYARVDADLENVRAALEWVGRGDDLERFADFVASLATYWHEYLRLTEGWGWMQEILPRRERLSPILRARIVTGACMISSSLYLFDEAATLGGEALTQWREVGGHRWPAVLSRQLGWSSYMGGESERSIGFLSAALDEWRQEGETPGIILALCDLALAHCVVGNLDVAASILDEAESLIHQHDEVGLTRLRLDRGLHALLSGNLEDAIALLDDAVRRLRLFGRNYLMNAAIFYQGTAYCFVDRLEDARRCYLESLDLPAAVDDKGHFTLTILGFAAVAARQGDFVRAAVLSGASQAIQQANGLAYPPAVQEIYDREITRVRESVSEEELLEAFTRGSQMTIEETVAFARAETDAGK